VTKLNINTSGIISKLKNRADLVAFILANYEQHSGLGGTFQYYTQKNLEFLKEAGRTFSSEGLLKHGSGAGSSGGSGQGNYEY